MPRLQISNSFFTWERVRDNAVLILLLIVIATTGAIRPVFLSTRNLINVLGQVSIIGILAMGTTFLMIAGQIDLSIGTAMSLVAVSVATFVTAFQMPLLPAFLIGIAIGGAIGAINGIIVARSTAQPFVITLGMMSVYQGVSLLVTGGYNISNLGAQFDTLGRIRVAGIPFAAIVFVLVSMVSAIVLRYRRIGRYAYLIGGRRKTAYLSGVPVARSIVTYYVMSGVLLALAGVLFTARIGSALPLMGAGYELQTIAAVVVGGTSLSGGRGSVRGTVLGVLLLGTISNSLNILRIDNYFQYIVFGAIIVVAVVAYGNEKN
jgi:inositol transport system permease protein